jgi:outer membrane protein
MLQKALLILNIILLAAVVYLFADRFSSSSKGNDAKTDTSEEAATGPLSVAYVNIDTLLNNYTIFKSKQEELSAREQQEDGKLRSRGKALEREIMALQEKAQMGTMTPKDLQNEEQRLMAKQQSFMEDQERISRELLAETTRINDELQGKIVATIKDFKEENGYDIVLSYGSGSPVLAIDESLDITRLVLSRLNQMATE